MFEELFKLKVNGYTLYYNLGRFYIFIIKILALLEYLVSRKDNAILRIKIKYLILKKPKNYLLDSLNLFKFSLKKLLISKRRIPSFI